MTWSYKKKKGNCNLIYHKIKFVNVVTYDCQGVMNEKHIKEVEIQ